VQGANASSAAPGDGAAAPGGDAADGVVSIGSLQELERYPAAVARNLFSHGFLKHAAADMDDEPGAVTFAVPPDLTFTDPLEEQARAAARAVRARVQPVACSRAPPCSHVCCGGRWALRVAACGAMGARAAGSVRRCPPHSVTFAGPRRPHPRCLSSAAACLSLGLK
jgi:hypothetical protein